MSMKDIMRPTALVVPGSAPNAYGIIRSLAEQGVPVLALDHAPSPLRRSRLCQFAVVPDPDRDAQAFVSAILALARDLPEAPVLFATQDLHALVIQQHAAQLASVVHFPFMPLERFAPCLDKALMLQMASAIGLPVPETYHPQDMRDVDALVPRLSRYPYVIKPVAKFDLRPDHPTRNMEFFRIFETKALRASSPAAVRYLAAEALAHDFVILVQEEITGPTENLMAVDFYVDRSGRLSGWHTGRKLRQYPADFGTCTLGRSTSEQGLLALCERFIRAVGFVGLGNMEFKERDGVPYLMEINPRAWMWIQMATAAGVNLPHRAYCDLLGLSAPAPATARPGTMWVDMRMDMLHRVGHRDGPTREAVPWRAWLGSLGAVRVEARLTPRDPGPFFDALLTAAARRMRP